MLIERVGVILEKYKTGLKARPYVGSLELGTLNCFPKSCGEFICNVSVLVGIKFSCNRRPQSNSALVLFPVPE